MRGDVAKAIAIAGGLWLGACSGSGAGDADQDSARAVEPRLNEEAPVVSPLPQGRFDEIRPALEQRANAGDRHAAYRLAEVHGRCADYAPMPVADLARMVANMASMGAQFGDETIDGDASLDLLVYGHGEMRRICAGTEKSETPLRPEVALAWNERAIALGHARAMVDYMDHAFIEYKTDADLFDNAAEVVRRRERARALTTRSLHLGEPRALLTLANGHGPDGIFGAAPIESYAAWHAFRDTEEGAALPETIAARLDTLFGGELSPDDRMRARLRAADLLAALHQAGAR